MRVCSKQFKDHCNAKYTVLAPSHIMAVSLNLWYHAVTMIKYITYSTKFFEGKKFSWIGLFQIFAEINFADEGVPLAMPTLAVACTVCDHSCNNAMLSCLLPNWSTFAQGQTSSRAFLVSFVWSSSTTRLKLETPLRWQTQCHLRWQPPGIWKLSLWNNGMWHVALDVHAIV